MTWQYDIEWHNGGGGNRKDRHRTSDLSTSTSQGGRKKTNSDTTNSSLYEGDSRLSIVVVTSKPRSQTAGNLITTHTWTSLMEKEDTNRSKQQMPANPKNKNITYSHKTLNTTIIYDDENKMRPLAIYVQVLRGSSPILKARVMMTTIVEQANGSKTRFPAVELKDNGYGGKITLKFKLNNNPLRVFAIHVKK